MIGVPAFAKKFGVSPDAVRRWCREGKIPRAEQDGKGKPWRIPDDATPPTKRKTARSGKSDVAGLKGWI